MVVEAFSFIACNSLVVDVSATLAVLKIATSSMYQPGSEEYFAVVSLNFIWKFLVKYLESMAMPSITQEYLLLLCPFILRLSIFSFRLNTLSQVPSAFLNQIS